MKLTNLGDLIELSYGKALKAPDRDGGEVPVVGSGGIVGSHSVAISTGPSLIVGRKGSIGSLTWIEGPAWPIDTAYFVRPRVGDLDLRWLYWRLGVVGLSTMNKSAAVPGLNREDVYRLSVEVPSIDEQRRIAAILDHADALRAKRRQMLDHFRSLTQSIFEDFFAGRLDSKACLVDLVDQDDRINYGIVQPGEHVADGVPLIRVSNLVGGRVDRRSLKLVSKDIESTYSRSRIRGTEILVSCVGSVGTVAVVRPDDVGSNVARAVARVPVSDPVLRSYLAQYLMSRSAQTYFSGEVRTVAQPTLNVKQLAALEIPIPPEVLQRDFAALAGGVRDRCEQMEIAARAEEVLFASLQARAFRGEL